MEISSVRYSQDRQAAALARGYSVAQLTALALALDPSRPRRE
jgi:hypothetical protein